MFKITAELCSRVTSNPHGVYRYDSVLFTYGYVNSTSEIVRKRFPVGILGDDATPFSSQVKTWAWEVLRRGEVDKSYLATTFDQLSVVAMQRWNDPVLCAVFHGLSNSVRNFKPVEPPLN